MLSPEAERVLRYLVEVEELAEAVLADKRQVGGPSAALGPGDQRRGVARGVRNLAPAPAGSEWTGTGGRWL